MARRIFNNDEIGATVFRESYAITHAVSVVPHGGVYFCGSHEIAEREASRLGYHHLALHKRWGDQMPRIFIYQMNEVA